MANVANTKATGPASKDAVSGGSTFTPRFKAQTGPIKELSNSSEDARRTIMGLRVASIGFGNDPGSAFLKKPSA